jgi:hypothetical protein
MRLVSAAAGLLGKAFFMANFATFVTLAAALGCSSAPLDSGSANAAVGGSSSGSGAGGAPAQTGSGNWAPYPSGPYGTVAGAVIENLSFLGWRQPDVAAYDPTHFETVRLSDFYNPDGSTDLKLLAVNASGVWCAVCRSEYQHFHTEGIYDKYRAKGVEFLGTLFEDNNYYPARPDDLVRWASYAQYQVKFPFVLDPGFKLGQFFSSDATPLNMLIDVRTMRIVSVTMGYSTDYWSSVDSLLQ